MRLDTFLQNSFQKKEIKHLLQKKKITIDGHFPKEKGQMIDPFYQKIVVNGKRIPGKAHKYFYFNKPKGVVTAKTDAKDPTVLDYFSEKDISYVGRLDKNSTGLVFLTNNGQLNYHMHQAKFAISKTYFVTVKETLDETDVAAFFKGIIIDGTVQLKPGKLEILSAHTGLVTITEGKFHQVKKMFLSCGKKVTDLHRISIGPLFLPENLKPGEFQEFTLEDFSLIQPFFNFD